MNLSPAQPMPDSLLAQARAGDRDAFARLVRAHQGSVFSIGLRMLNRRDAAEDLAQDVFLQLYRKIRSHAAQPVPQVFERLAAPPALQRDAATR